MMRALLNIRSQECLTLHPRVPIRENGDFFMGENDHYPWISSQDLGAPLFSEKAISEPLLVGCIEYLVLSTIFEMMTPQITNSIFWDGLKRPDDDSNDDVKMEDALHVTSQSHSTVHSHTAPRNTCCPDGSACPSAATSQLDGCSKKKTSCVSQEIVT